MQSDETSASENDIGKFADMTDIAFDTASGMSRQEITGLASQENFFIYGYVPDPGLDKTGANNQYYVLANEHMFRNVGLATYIAGA